MQIASFSLQWGALTTRRYRGGGGGATAISLHTPVPCTISPEQFLSWGGGGGDNFWQAQIQSLDQFSISGGEGGDYSLQAQPIKQYGS